MSRQSKGSTLKRNTSICKQFWIKASVQRELRKMYHLLRRHLVFNLTFSHYNTELSIISKVIFLKNAMLYALKT
jgi:hypothetical protein